MSLNPKTGVMVKPLRQIIAEWIAPTITPAPSLVELLTQERARARAAFLAAEDEQERAAYTVKMLEARLARLTKRLTEAEGANE